MFLNPQSIFFSNINDKLDILQSGLDAWAHLGHEEADKSTTEAPSAATTTTKPKLKLFSIRTLPPRTTTTTTTFKPKSLADLFRHREGFKPETPTTTAASTTTEATPSPAGKYD